MDFKILITNNNELHVITNLHYNRTTLDFRIIFWRPALFNYMLESVFKILKGVGG